MFNFPFKSSVFGWEVDDECRDRFRTSDPSGVIWKNLTNKSLISVVTRPRFSSFLDPPQITVGIWSKKQR